MAYSKAKLKRSGDRVSAYFKPFLRGNIPNSRLPRFCYMFQSDTFLLVLPVSWDTKLNQNIIGDLPPN